MKHVIRLILSFETAVPLTQKDLNRRGLRAADCIHAHINEDVDECALPGSQCTYDVASEGDPLYTEIMAAKRDHDLKAASKYLANPDYAPVWGEPAPLEEIEQ